MWCYALQCNRRNKVEGNNRERGSAARIFSPKSFALKVSIAFLLFGSEVLHMTHFSPNHLVLILLQDCIIAGIANGYLCKCSGVLISESGKKMYTHGEV
jgi:hypothetical protein